MAFRRPVLAAIAASFCLAAAEINDSGSKLATPAAVTERFERLNVMCDDVLDKVTAQPSGQPSPDDVQAAANCFVKAAKDRATAIWEIMDSLPEPNSAEDCERNVPVLTALFEAATPFWGSIRETMVRPAKEGSFKHAGDRLCVLMSYYLNSYTCLDHVDVPRLHQAVHRDYEIYYGESYDVADEVNQLPGGASREDEFTIFPCIDLGQSVASILIERADAEHSKAYEDGELSDKEAAKIQEMRDLRFDPLSTDDLERQSMFKDSIRLVPLVDKVVYQEIFRLGEDDQPQGERMPPGWESMREAMSGRMVEAEGQGQGHQHDSTEL